MKYSFRSFLRPLSYGLLVLLLAGLLFSQRADLGRAVQAATDANGWWIAVGCVCMAASVVLTSIVYQLLSPRPLPFASTLLVQTSSLFVNKILPAGSGAIGVSYLYLRNNRVDTMSATLIVILNNFFGFVGHAILLMVVLLFGADDLPMPKLSPIDIRVGWLLPVAASVVLLLVALLALSRRRIRGYFTVQKRRKLRVLLSRPGRTAGALLTSIALTLCYVGCLHAAAASIGIHLSLPVTLLVLTLSVLATVVMPVPGGIGAAEAGVFLALRAFGIDSAQALLVAFLYRFMTFWLPLVFGLAAFPVVQKKRLLTHSQ
jgi:uncharacterized membrane protein YbhN (UPF0104 family)